MRLRTDPRASKLQRPANSALRRGEYLTPTEVDKLISAARSGRYGHRDATLILIAYRHGLRASEIVMIASQDKTLGGTLAAARKGNP